MKKKCGHVGSEVRTFNISAKGPPKRLNSATFGMKIYWPKMMFECCLMIQIDALRPPILIYASKNRT